MWSRVLRFVAALILAATAWYNLSPAYGRFLAAAAAPLLKIDARFGEANITAIQRFMRVGGSVPLADVPASELTYNVILLVALFAANGRPLSAGNVRGFLISLVILVVMHIVAVVLSIEATYAAHMGEYSQAHYGTGGYFFWVYAELFYRLVGMFGVVFACWWLTGERTVRS